MTSAYERIDQGFLLIGRNFTDMTRRAGQLDRSAMTLLACLDAGGPMSLSELSTVLGRDVSTLNRQTAALLRDDLAERIPDPQGGIARKFRITVRGKNRLDDERANNRKATTLLLEGWTDDEIEGFAASLERFNAAIEARSGRHWPSARQR
ncbi:MarR family transcriptional regulator [Microbacterium protaetiae]|uniref:MarR family transcriptional regulator n=1 Tax=Microbacterium protaetiae TaxID=2509458 RepID=A0A4P6EBQ4_9MICO|nr:MarR family transcriptional regulator [Microbacterium protaetiae]QAY59615.1 MarR family transcriptional regulator [Microbacterium protaetiae]